MAMSSESNIQNKAFSARDIAYIAFMVALIEVCKSGLLFLPNIELTSFWIIMFMLFYGRKTYLVIPAFILVEGALYGFGLWCLMYLYTWPLLGLLTWIFRRMDSLLFWCFLSCMFGLSFGFLCSFPYFFMGLASGGIRQAFSVQIGWWVAGIPWDIAHGVGNFILMLILYTPVSKLMRKLYKKEKVTAEAKG